MAEPEVFKRLPTCVVPQKYHVHYELIDLLNFRFEGSERVVLRVEEPTSVITCHAVELYVFDVVVEDAASSWKTQQAQQIQYQLRGFYRTEYENQREKRVLAVTQFEACDARRAFVCWDEPALKATFELSMVTDVDLVALSNAHVVETLVRPRKNAHIRENTRADVGGTMEKLWKFAESPVMSTYLVAMVVGEFDMISDLTEEGVVVNVYTAPGQSARGRFALNVATKALSFFTERFGIPYPLKKLDMVAIPDFLGAMENWGLVTYTETYLLVDEKLSSHETPCYLRTDRVVVNHPQEADEIFDAISYHKGSSIVRMLSEYLGQDVFYRGVHDYLINFSYKNTVTEDLWEALEKASGQKLKDMADTWTKQPEHGDNTLWDVPLAFCTSDDPKTIKRIGIWDAKTASLKNSTKLTTPLAAGDEINKQIQRLETPVKEQLLGVPDRVSLLNSVFTFARGGVLELPVALDFTNSYVDESASLCWKEISRNMGYYSNLFRDEPFYPEFQRYIRTLFAHVMTRLGWDADSSKQGDADEGEFRKTVIYRLGLANDEDVLIEAKKRFHAYTGGDSSALSGDLRGAIFDIEVTNGDASNAKLLQELHNKSDFAEERSDCLGAMGSVSGATAKLQVLEWAVENARSQDIHYPFASVASDKLGAQVAWQYVQDKWDFLSKKYSAMTLGFIVCAVVSRFQSEASAVEVEAFMVSKDTSGYKRRLEVALEGVRLKSAAYCRDRETLAKWLKERAV
ncbi:Aminopeptidase M1-B [Phytophthora ramorum]|uniref:Aminopeptidase M1-B n=1 Tax=Phytophthora ramorum TaxID=164328 RepID=UPI0030A82F8C|nr:Aminopeptidase M1-B [Phytophthora ramorum]